jgi:hypothetical protein
VLWLHWDRYVAFLARSSARSLWETLVSLNVSMLGIPFAVRLAARPPAPHGLDAVSLQLLACLAATIVVATLFAFVHPRYLTRSYGLTAVIVVAGARTLGQRPGLNWMRACPILALAANLSMLSEYLSRPHAF